MTPGVGSITGRITEDGQPLGGVTLTASNGDVTRTTTSLTEGDRGLFTLPAARHPRPLHRHRVARRLRHPDPARHARRQRRPASTSTSSRRPGRSPASSISSNGGPLAGANIRVSRDELSFDTNSAVAPDPGSFTITDLPPGTYLVEFSRFDHDAASQLVTVAAGQVVDLGQIVLQFRERPDIPQTGSLVVRVVDSEGTPLTGAEVRLVDVATGELVASSQRPGINAQSTFVFLDPLPIGTYRVEVIKRPDYRRGRAPGLDRARPSDGSSFQLFQLGQASGRILDSRDGRRARRLRRADLPRRPKLQPAGGTRRSRCPAHRRRPDIGPNDDRIGWESPPNSLTRGIYRIAIAGRPPGYRVRTTRSSWTATRRCSSRSAPTDEAPIMFNDLLADLNPSLTGQIVVPRRDPTGTTRSRRSTTTSLPCRCRCGAFGPVSADAAGRSVRRPRHGTGLRPLLLQRHHDGREQPARSVRAHGERHRVRDRCQAASFPAAAVGRRTRPAGQGRQRGAVPAPRRRRPRLLDGHRQRRRRGPALSGVTVRTEGQVIVGFDPAEGGDPTPTDRHPRRCPRSTGATGGWAFIDPKQVFGTTSTGSTTAATSPARSASPSTRAGAAGA